jgi:uncharacterized protein
MRVHGLLMSVAVLLLALAGPAVVAVIGTRAAEIWQNTLPQILSVAAIVLIVVAAYAVAIRVEECSWKSLGFADTSWWSIPIGLLLAGFFIGIVGPLAYWTLAQLGIAGFDAGLRKVSALPLWLLVLTIIVVAPAEELLYRAYAIERLGTLIGSRPIAGAASLCAFALAHVPLWGWGPALTTIVAGAVATIVYLVRADVVALAIAHIAADLCGLVVPHLAR